MATCICALCGEYPGVGCLESCREVVDWPDRVHPAASFTAGAAILFVHPLFWGFWFNLVRGWL